MQLEVKDYMKQFYVTFVPLSLKPELALSGRLLIDLYVALRESLA